MFPSVSDSILTVDDVTNKIREAVCSAPGLQNISMRGELLGFKRHTSGHAYFTILGKESRISCVLFRSNASSVLTWPKDGDEVLVRGRVDIYGARGSYQIYATTLLPLGAGAKARAKEMLMKQLEQEGLFDPRHKRPIPRYPQKVAVITSPTGAALQDIIKISSVRYPAARLLIVPSLMQGVSAHEEIVQAFVRCAGLPDLDLVILARGGGSRDDLDPFDNEAVVRAVRSCPVPVVTGLGHQIDSTLADLAADISAPTPSGAAERVFPDKMELLGTLRSTERVMWRDVAKRFQTLETALANAKRRLQFSFITSRCNPAAEFIENSYQQMKNYLLFRLSDSDAKLKSLAASLQSASPLTILSKGYAICRDESGAILRDVALLAPGQDISLQMRDGAARVQVQDVLPAGVEGSAD